MPPKRKLDAPLNAVELLGATIPGHDPDSTVYAYPPLGRVCPCLIVPNSVHTSWNAVMAVVPQDAPSSSNDEQCIRSALGIVASCAAKELKTVDRLAFLTRLACRDHNDPLYMEDAPRIIERTLDMVRDEHQSRQGSSKALDAAIDRTRGTLIPDPRPWSPLVLWEVDIHKHAENWELLKEWRNSDWGSLSIEEINHRYQSLDSQAVSRPRPGAKPSGHQHSQIGALEKRLRYLHLPVPKSERKRRRQAKQQADFRE